MPTNTSKEMLETTAFLQDEVVFRKLQFIYRNLPISDRDVPDLIQDLFRDLDGEGVELWRPEEFVPYPLIDTAWGGNARYLRTFLSLDRCKYPERDVYLVLLLKKRFPKLYGHLLR